MKITIQRDDLVAATAAAVRAITSRPLSPVMAGMLISADAEGVVNATGFDYDTLITATESARVDEPGSLLLPGRAFAAAVAALPSGATELAAAGDAVELRGGRVRYTMRALPIGDYPPLPEHVAPTGKVDAADLADRVARTALAASNDVVVPALAAIRITTDSATMELAAADRYQIARHELSWEGGSESALLPAKALGDAVKGLSGRVRVGFDTNRVTFASERRTATLRQVDEKFPNIDRFLTDPDGATVVTVDRYELIDAAQRAKAAIDDKRPMVLSVGADGIDYATTGGQADVSGRIDAKVDGPGLRIGINPAWLAAALKAVKSERARITLGPTARTPLHITDDSAGLHVLMPIALAD